MSQKLLCYAHRGGRQGYSENSLSAIEQALKVGVDGIEIDIWNVGGELLVTHDRRLGRLLPGEGLITDQSPAELRQQQLSCGSFTPNLREVLELVGDQCELNIEIKGQRSSALLCELLDDFCRATNSTPDQYLISSFDQRQLFDCMQRLPAVRRGVLVAGIPLDLAQCGEGLGAFSMHSELSFVTDEFVQDARRRGMKNFVYTVNHWDDFMLMSQMQVDGVFTDYPEKLNRFNANVPATHCEAPRPSSAPLA
ncbi:glycerophosphodiester phosphodiesterase [Biformimicrobium ophioploci]|uniref:Glycerophosphodiester phosphodiesterase n=1 Tax=Biformimicrobium ophioploci TaxID=3036711 RepID=A0ABQ6LWN8_9GAMM|nr:glycerophosphodiester phosphodiesterase [Microbulbifer sp. NKW57]GMG86476.1 glycerophosphodiester phosphodiesterase [Microbulbifer sp. NKW57]